MGEGDANTLRTSLAQGLVWPNAEKGEAVLLKALRATSPRLLAANRKSFVLLASRERLVHCCITLQPTPILRVHCVQSKAVRHAAQQKRRNAQQRGQD